jgi:hypothetical protein
MGTNYFYMITTKAAADAAGKYNNIETQTLPSGQRIRVEYNHYFETLPGDRVVRTNKLFNTTEQALGYVLAHYDKGEWSGNVEILSMHRAILSCGCSDGWCDCNV